MLLILLFGCCLLRPYGILHAQTTNFFSDKTSDMGIAVGFVGGGEVSMDFDPYVTKKTSSFMIKGIYDSYLLPQLATGLYVHIATTPVNMHYTDTYSEPEWIDNQWVYTERKTEYSYDLGVFTWEIGGSIKRRFFIGENWAAKIGGNIGYRKFYFNEDDLKAADVLRYFEDEDQKAQAAGMAVNASLEIQYHLPESKYIVFGELGILNQPYGGTRHVTDMNFGPILYVMIGAAL
ncbi:hypothetical protein JW960_00800 [candidate division KSB1 bacterium]|nr:hypothetical protein [candidate division KSB1 bacterium]